jgi:hypothetical protein
MMICIIMRDMKKGAAPPERYGGAACASPVA